MNCLLIKALLATCQLKSGQEYDFDFDHQFIETEKYDAKPTLRTCSADTILRAIEELTCKNITYKSASGNSYDFNTADKMNCLLIKALLATGQLKSGQEYDFDFDHQFIETEKYDAKPTYPQIRNL